MYGRRPPRTAKAFVVGLTAAVTCVLMLGCGTTRTDDPGTPPSPSEATPSLSPAPGTTTRTAAPREDITVRIRLIVDGRAATAALNDTATARDLASLLPLTLDMHDLFGREKPGLLPRPLAAGQGQATHQIGDLGYWAPSHDFAIFYADDGQRIPSPGIVIIGRVDSGLELIAEAGDSFQLTIESVR